MTVALNTRFFFEIGESTVTEIVDPTGGMNFADSKAPLREKSTITALWLTPS